MKKLVLLAVILGLTSSLCYADYVRGYYKSNGTYVNGYNRTHPNYTKMDNYSTRGNYNPYTGQQGTKNPYNYNYNYNQNYNNQRNNGYYNY